MPTDLRREAERLGGLRKELGEKGWYHSIELPGGELHEGIQTLDQQRRRFAHFPIPENLAGKTVLDIGAWDGWFSFEAERRGAQVTAMDVVELPTLLYAREKLSSKVDYRVLDLFELPNAGFKPFDYVFCLGLLYHVKHPLLSLEIVCSLTRQIAIVDSFVTDASEWRQHENDTPTLEFYETDDLGGQLDNWFGPSVSALLGMCRAAGFARVELLNTDGNTAIAACYRQWDPEPEAPAEPPPEIDNIFNTRSLGINASARRDEYLTIWFRSAVKVASRQTVKVEIGGFGIPAMHVARYRDELWHVNVRIPPGLAPGWQPVRVRTAGSRFSEPGRIAIDLAADTASLEIGGACDGNTWEVNVLRLGPSPALALWIKGLPENCDCANTRVYLGENRLTTTYLGEPDVNAFRQVNAALPLPLAAGPYSCVVKLGNAVSAPVAIHAKE